MNKFNLKSKLIILVLFPVLALFFLSTNLIYDKYTTFTKLDRLNNAVYLSKAIEELIYSLQKERGLSNGYKGSEGNEFKEALLLQKEHTNISIKNLHNYAQTLDLKAYKTVLKNKLEETHTNLEQLNTIREQVASLHISNTDIHQYYTHLITHYLDIIGLIADFSNNNHITKQLISHNYLILAIENLALERGLGTLLSSSNLFPSSVLDTFTKTIYEQEFYLHLFEQSIDQQNLTTFIEVNRHPVVKESLRLRKILLAASSIDTTTWFNTLTQKIILLQNLEEQLIHTITQTTSTLSNNAKNEMVFYIFLYFIIILFVLIFGRFIGLKIVHSVESLLIGLDGFFNFVNKKSAHVEPIEIHSNDEIGKISKMLNEKILLSKMIIDEDIVQRAKELEEEVKRKTHDLEVSNKEYAILLERFNESVTATRTDTQGIITFATNKFCQSSGYTQEEIIGRNHNIVRHPDNPTSFYKTLWETIKSGKEFRAELKNRRKDGTDFWVNLYITPEWDENNQIIGYFSIKENIEDKIKIREFNKELEIKIKKAIEENRKKDEILVYQSKLASLGEMIGVIAHQWKQPLSALSMQIQMIKLTHSLNKEEIDEEYIDTYINKNMDVIQFMTKTINDFRNFYRQDKVKTNFTVHDAIQTTLTIFKAQLNESRIKVTLEGENFTTHGLQSEFQQVISNLISNAKDALVEKEIANKEIIICTKKEAHQGLVLFDDNAQGIPEEIIDKVFEPYYTTKPLGKGTGIGLNISKTIIENTMNGSISVCNTEKGACFIITLPLSS